MISKYEKELKTRAGDLISILNTKGFEAYIDVYSLKEYNIKVNVDSNNIANIYYSGKKREYSLVTTEIKNIGVRNIVEEVWEEIENAASKTQKTIKKDRANNSEDILIYVDGSFYNNGYGYGLAVVKNDEMIFSDYGYIEEKIFREQNNIGGELVASIKAMEWCKKNNINNVFILHDYVGVAKFANGTFKAKTPSTSYYHNKMKQFGISPKFVKVAAHSNNKWNDVVDNLAKKGALSDPYTEAVKLKIEETKSLQTEVAAGFADYLVLKGINAEIIEMNSLYAVRVGININRKKIFFDVYNSKNRKINEPYIANGAETDKKMLLGHYKAYLFKNNLK